MEPSVTIIWERKGQAISCDGRSGSIKIERQLTGGVINKVWLDSNIDTLVPDAFFAFCSLIKLSHKVATTIATD